MRQAWRIERWPATIGRALDNDVVLTDPHVAAYHASIGVDDPGAPGRLAVHAGDTRNGLAVGRERLRAGETKTIVEDGRDLDLSIGRTQLRLRLPGHALAPEMALAPVATREQRWWPTSVLALAVLALVLGNTWLDTDPDNLSRALANTVLTTLTGAVLWCGVWALLSKTFTRQGSFGWHLRVFTVASLAMIALSALPPLLAFSFSWPWLTDFSFVAVYAALATAVYFHLLAVEPARERLMRAVVASGFAAAVAVSLWFNVQRTGRLGEELYMNHLFPPQLRAAKPVSVDRFIDGLAPAQAILDRKAREPGRGDNDGHEGGDDED